MREDMLAGKEANGEAGVGGGGDGVVGKNGRSELGGGGGREGGSGGGGDDGGVESSGNKGWWRIRRLGINVGVVTDEKWKQEKKKRRREMVVGMADSAGARTTTIDSKLAYNFLGL